MTAKHGQSPTDHSKLVKNGDTLAKLLQANNYLDPNGNFGQNATKTGNLNDGSGLVGTGFVQSDDVGLIWLRDQHQLRAGREDAQGQSELQCAGHLRGRAACLLLYGPRIAARVRRSARGPHAGYHRAAESGCDLYVEHVEG